MDRDTSSRKWQCTINNPDEHGLTRTDIKALIEQLKSVKYYCISDEIGLEGETPHTHFFIVASAPIRFSRIKKLFPVAHIEQAHGSCIENSAYISKTGKWENDIKHGTHVQGSFEEWGDMPEEPGQGSRSDYQLLYQLVVEDGKSNAEITAMNPDLIAHIGKMDKLRQDNLEQQYKSVRRELNVTYIYGATGTGKTRHVMDKYGYSSVYRVTDYDHPFDRYASEPVICFDEFRSSLRLGDMLTYLDCYPLTLPARYANRVACYNEVYIISNISLDEQYTQVQQNEPATWKAFLRRINSVMRFDKDEPPYCYGSAEDYINRHDWVSKAKTAPDIDDCEQLPL